MSADVGDAVGFVASQANRSGELAACVDHCARTGQRLVLTSPNAVQVAKALLKANPGLRIRVDRAAWRGNRATPENPLHVEQSLFGEDDWSEVQLPVSSGIEGYTPSLFLRANDRDARRELLARTADPPSNITTLIAIEASVLAAVHRDAFFDDLVATPTRPFAFVFADGRPPFRFGERIEGLRRLLQRFPGSEIAYVDPLIAADALGHGAGRVGVGSSGSLRRPGGPGDTNTPRPVANGFLPGLFLLELLELRTPAIYLNWFAAVSSPHCSTCRRYLDAFAATPDDRALIIAHNLHQTSEHLAELLELPAARRSGWLREQRAAARDRHLALRPPDGVEQDITLRRLLELDGAAHRPVSRPRRPARRWPPTQAQPPSHQLRPERP